MKKIICILAIITLSTSLFSCSKSSNESDASPGTIIEETEESITIVDQAKRQVTIPKEINSSALCYRVIARFILNLDEGDKIKGIGKREAFFNKVQPSMEDAKNVGMGVVDIEALAKLSPDVFIHKASDKKTLEKVEAIGIPALGLDLETTKDMKVALDILGKVFHKEAKAKQLITYYDDKIKVSKEKTEKIKDKKTAIVMGSTIGKVANGSMLQSEMLEIAGGINPAKSIETKESWPTVGVEEIFKWNPDYIFITKSESADYSVEDILKDPTWSKLKAVKNKNIYLIPSQLDSWEFPGVVSTIGIDYMTNVMYPNLLSEEELNSNVEEFYKIAYGKKFTRDELGY